MISYRLARAITSTTAETVVASAKSLGVTSRPKDLRAFWHSSTTSSESNPRSFRLASGETISTSAPRDRIWFETNSSISAVVKEAEDLDVIIVPFRGMWARIERCCYMLRQALGPAVVGSSLLRRRRRYRALWTMST